VTSASDTASAWVGRSIERIEDAALLSGRGHYADDAGVKPGTLAAAILRSPHAHAELLAIDAAAALALPGVRAVLTGADVKTWAKPFVVGVRQPMEHWCLAIDRVRYVGEPVAVVVADNRYVAEDALDLIRAEYRPLPATVDPEQAAQPGAPVLHESVGSNVVSDRSFAYGDPDAVFAAAAHRVQLKVRYPRNAGMPIECYVVVAEHQPDAGAYDVFSNFQGPFALHPVMALALGIAGSKLRLRTPRDSGGSFGSKQAVFQYIVLMCLAARKARAPVKWVEDRLEHLVAATSATNRVTTIEAAVENDGTIAALRYDQLDDCGAYLRAPEPATFYRMHGVLTGAYAVRHLAVRNRVVLTNKTPAGLMRGFGGPQVYFALERLMQRIAVELGLDPIDVYRRNFVPAGAFPYHAPAGALLDSGDYAALLELALRDGGLAELQRRRDAARAEGRLYGIGFAAIVEPSISNMGYITTALTPVQRAKAGPKNGAIASATVNVDALGSVSVVLDSTPQGQGHATAVAQVVADALGIAPQQVAVNTELDTQKDAWSIAAGNYSSRFAGATAGAAHLAATRVRERLARIAAAQFGVDPSLIEFSGGKVFPRTQPDNGIAFHRLAGGTHWSPGQLPEGMPPALRETALWTPQPLAAPDAQDRVNTSLCYGFAFDICAVEIDRVTGQIRIDRYVTAHDAGKLLNPALAEGQVRGAFAQGLGSALLEEFAYGDDGSFLSGTFADYLLPTAMEVPEPLILHRETPSPFTPLGAKGLGESNMMSTPVAIANAVADALGDAADAAQITLPLTPSRVMQLLGMADPEPANAQPEIAAAGAAESAKRPGRALAMSGAINIGAPPERVFRALLDPVVLKKIVPGCHELTATAENHYRADVTLGVGVVKARLRAEVALSELDPPYSLRLSGAGSGALGAVQGSGKVVLNAADGGTRLDYDYAVNVSGKLAAVGGRMLEGASRVVLKQLFERLDAAIGSGGPAGGDARPAGFWRRLLRRLRGAR
jgi:2-furoyl-CoA dehydrogenase large subunit